ncbi:unnamed protein product [Ixodes hexagonus]
MTSLIKRYKLRKFATCLSGCIFWGKAVVAPEGISFIRMNGILFCVDRLDKSRRLNSYVEAVRDDGRHILGRIVSIFSSPQERSGSGQREGSVSFCVQELKCLSVPADLSGYPVVVRSFACVELSHHIVKVNAFLVRKCIALKVEDSLFLCRVDQTYMLEAA